MQSKQHGKEAHSKAIVLLAMCARHPVSQGHMHCSAGTVAVVPMRRSA
jgi:hypothetical protein